MDWLRYFSWCLVLCVELGFDIFRLSTIIIKLLQFKYSKISYLRVVFFSTGCFVLQLTAIFFKQFKLSLSIVVNFFWLSQLLLTNCWAILKLYLMMGCSLVSSARSYTNVLTLFTKDYCEFLPYPLTTLFLNSHTDSKQLKDICRIVFLNWSGKLLLNTSKNFIIYLSLREARISFSFFSGFILTNILM